MAARIMRRVTLADVSLVAVLSVTSWFEFHLGQHVLQLPWGLALAVPAAVDTYVVSAMRARQDQFAAVLLMLASLVLSTASEIVVLDDRTKLVIACCYCGVLVLVLWRVHELHAATSDLTGRVAAAEALTAEHAAAVVAAQERAGQLAQELDAERAAAAAAQAEAAHAEAAHAAAARPKPATPNPAAAKPSGRPTAAGRSASDPEHLDAVLALIRPLIVGNPDVGRKPVVDVLREQGFSCSTDRARDLLALARRPHAV